MNSQRGFYLFAFRAFGDFSVTIAVPAVGAAFLGKWLDQKWQTEPLFLISFLALAFLLTAVIVVKKTKKYGEEYQRMIEDKKS
jgi:F0F1-type ATP synthase assembly protein I